MSTVTDKAPHEEMITKIRERWSALSSSSPIKQAVRETDINEMEQKIAESSTESLHLSYWNPTLLFLYRASEDAHCQLEEDLSLIEANSPQKSLPAPMQFLRAKVGQERQWVAGIFETFAKARALRRKIGRVWFDHKLSNGRDCDILVEVNDRKYWLECTVLSESDEDKLVWDRFIEKATIDPSAVLTRPGKFEPPNPKGPSSYYDCFRFYKKMYDKIALDFDPNKTQLSNEQPNILLVSIYSPRAPLDAGSMGIGWALDELFADQPKGTIVLKDPSPAANVSLTRWLEYAAADLSEKGVLDLQNYGRDYGELISGPRKLGGLLLFNTCSFQKSRVNYNAKKECSLSHKEMTLFEDLFDSPPPYCN